MAARSPPHLRRKGHGGRLKCRKDTVWEKTFELGDENSTLSFCLPARLIFQGSLETEMPFLNLSNLHLQINEVLNQSRRCIYTYSVPVSNSVSYGLFTTTDSNKLNLIAS